MTEDSLVNSAGEHIALFNSCVDSGDWSPFVSTYEQDAVLEIDGFQPAAFQGREAIARFYTSHPPQEHMHAEEITTISEQTTRVIFKWDSGGRAELTTRWDGPSVKHARLSPST